MVGENDDRLIGQIYYSSQLLDCLYEASDFLFGRSVSELSFLETSAKEYD